MIKALSSLIRRLDFYLRNQPYHPESENRLITHSWDDVFDPDPLRTRVYWSIRRWSKNVWDFPRDFYYSLVYAYQRLTRGWDDRAVWSIDYWLDDIMPDMLRQLKQDKHGFPIAMFEGLPTLPDEPWNHTEEAYEIAEARWNDILDKIIAAFEASRRMNNGLYTEELGEYPLRRPKGTDKESWNKIRDDRFYAAEELRKRDMHIFEEGMKLFSSYYHNLWD